MTEMDITEFYRGKNIFITGGTGFVGIALVEKILRSLPDVGTLYLLVRPKNGKPVGVRLEEYTKNAPLQTTLTIMSTNLPPVRVRFCVLQHSSGMNTLSHIGSLPNNDIPKFVASSLDQYCSQVPTLGNERQFKMRFYEVTFRHYFYDWVKLSFDPVRILMYWEPWQRTSSAKALMLEEGYDLTIIETCRWKRRGRDLVFKIFQRLRCEQGDDVFKKLVPLAGDVGEENLGLSDADRQTVIEKVNVVFHSAATLDFEASLKTTVIINLLGTRRVVQLCKEIQHLSALLHVSSAYVNSNLKSADEILYPQPGDVEKVVQVALTMTDEAINDLTPTLLGTHLNTYTFTKALAELEVANSISSFPSCIVRPSMITAAWKEPTPGWTISKNGPQGFMMGAGKGVVRRLPMNTELVCDYIPVDTVVNSMIAGAYHTGIKRPTETPIFHITSSTYKPFRWHYVISVMDSYLHRYPLRSAAWYPHMKFIPSLFWFKVSAMIFHILPAYILDAVTFVTGGRPVLRKMHRNIFRSLDRLEPFIFNEWMFDNKKTLELHATLSPGDQEKFGVDIGRLDWVPYFENLIKGVREYLHNEKLSTLEAAKKKNNVLWFFNILVQTLFLGSFWMLFSLISGFTMSESYWILPIIGSIFFLL